MASTRSYMISRRPTTSYRFLSTDSIHPPTKPTELEFDESDIWGGSTRADSSPPPPSPIWKQPRRPIPPKGGGRCGETASSLPVNIPDWSKILREEYKGEKWGFDDGGDDVVGEDEWVPPHEYLARTRIASFSVHEGIGRTLKGRDLSKVRNAIWEKTGFED